MREFADIRLTGDLMGKGTIRVAPGKMILRKGGIPASLSFPICLLVTVGGLLAAMYLLGEESFNDGWGLSYGIVPGSIAVAILWPRRRRSLMVPNRQYVVLSPGATLAERLREVQEEHAVVSIVDPLDPDQVDAALREFGISPDRTRLALVSRWKPGTRSLRLDCDERGMILVAFASEEDARVCWEVYRQTRESGE